MYTMPSASHVAVHKRMPGRFAHGALFVLQRQTSVYVASGYANTRNSREGMYAMGVMRRRCGIRRDAFVERASFPRRHCPIRKNHGLARSHISARSEDDAGFGADLELSNPFGIIWK